MLLAGLVVLFAAFGVPLAAQDQPDANTPADSQLAGTVRTPEGTPVPGSTLRVIQTATGKAWITWTDENGKFEFPALPEGHYRVEISQLGFAPGTKEIDVASGTQAPVDLKLDVGTLAAITAPPATENAAKTPSAPAAAGAATATSSPSTTAANNSAAIPHGGKNDSRNGQQSGPGSLGQGGGRRAFQQVGLNGQNQKPLETGTEDQNIAGDGGQLGQVASADAVQMIGTVAMAQSPSGSSPQTGDSGPDTRSGFGNGDNTIPGQAAPAGFGGPWRPKAGADSGGGPGGRRWARRPTRARPSGWTARC